MVMTNVSVRERLLIAEQQLSETFVSRGAAIRMILLAHLCGEHYLLVGTPGVAKTALARAFAQHVTGGRLFATLLGAFSSPEKVFGPLSIAAFQQGRYEVVRDGKLADCEFGFLDEYFKCNEGCLNELLTILNEREFEGTRVPLMTCGTATNWPEIEARTENVAALYDRILLRCVVEDLTDEGDVVELLDKVDRVEEYRPQSTVDVEELRQAMAEVRQVTISEPIRKLLHNVRFRLSVRQVGDQERPGVAISGRRIGALQRVLKASAWLAGRNEVGVADFETLIFGLWNDRREIEQVQAVLDTLDAELVRELVKRIDEVRTEYDRVKRNGFGPTKVNELNARIEAVARETRIALDAPVYTAAGRRTVSEAIAPLKQIVIELEQRVCEQEPAVEEGE